MRFENDAQGMAVDYHELRNAVSLGGDRDTLACITGGIAEAFYGMPPRVAAGNLEASAGGDAGGAWNGQRVNSSK